MSRTCARNEFRSSDISSETRTFGVDKLDNLGKETIADYTKGNMTGFHVFARPWREGLPQLSKIRNSFLYTVWSKS